MQEERASIATQRDALDGAWKAEREVAERLEESSARRRFLEMQVRKRGLGRRTIDPGQLYMRR